jgi:hypothetical protein
MLAGLGVPVGPAIGAKALAILPAKLAFRQCEDQEIAQVGGDIDINAASGKIRNFRIVVGSRGLRTTQNIEHRSMHFERLIKHGETAIALEPDQRLEIEPELQVGVMPVQGQIGLNRTGEDRGIKIQVLRIQRLRDPMDTRKIGREMDFHRA